MQKPTIKDALDRLRDAADRVRFGFPKTHWQRVQGPGPDNLELEGNSVFTGLKLEPGVPLKLRCSVTLPASVLGVSLQGDSLEGILNSLYPVEISWNGAAVFSAGGVPVAAGPALIELIPQLQAGDNGVLELIVSPPDHQMTVWVNLHLRTPRLRARFELLDVAWSQLALAEEVAASDEELEVVLQAASSVPDDLELCESAVLEQAFARMTLLLAPLNKKSDAISVHLIGHSHIDMNWLWTWPDTVEVIRRDITSVLTLMREFPEFTFSHSQPATYEVIREEEPEAFNEILAHIQTGRWEPLTMCWIEGDVNMASGEALARQLLQGVSYSREVLHFSPSSFHAPDTFGHAGNLPQLASSAGAIRYYHHRANAGQENQWPAYWWEGQDGSRILGISTYSYNGEILARDIAAAAIRAHRHGLPAGVHFHGVGDHGGGPSRQNLEALRRFQCSGGLGHPFCSTLARYTTQLLNSGPALPLHRGESSTIFEGCYTTHADTKRYNREGENLLCTADTLAALAGLDENKALTEAWRKVLFNQFHDILDGSAIHEAYEKNAADFDEVRLTANSVISRALDVLEQTVDGGDIAVTNPSGFDRIDWVTAPTAECEDDCWVVSQAGVRTPAQKTSGGLGFAATVPAFGTTAYRIETFAAGSKPDSLMAVPSYAPTDERRASFLAETSEEPPYYFVETRFFKAYVRRDSGIIVGLLDKRVGRQLVGFGMRRGSDYVDTARADLALNVLQILDEHPHGMTAWHYDEIHSEQSLLRGATTRVLEAGPVRLVLQTVHSLRSSTVVQDIIFYQDLPRIDFETRVDWNEPGDATAGIPNLKVAFTARMPEAEAWFETPFGAVQRPCDGQESPALRWIDTGGTTYGMALLNDSKYGHDVLGTRARITLLRSAYDPDAIADIGPHTIRYSLMPHVGNWRDAGVVREAAGFNQPLLARSVRSLSPGSRPTSIARPTLRSPSSVDIACLKTSHDGTGLIIRLYETAGRAVEIELAGLSPSAIVWETNIIEDRAGRINASSGTVHLVFKPWQVRTLLVETSVREDIK